MKKNNGVRLLCVASVALAVTACDQLPGNNRYEIQKDGSGRTIRLDKQTGDVAILEGDKLVPASSQQQVAATEATEKVHLYELAQPKFLPNNPPVQLGAKTGTCQTMWRDGKVFILAQFTPPLRPPSRSFGIGLTGYRIHFLDASGFSIVDEAVPTANVTTVLDEKSKPYGTQISWSLPLSQDAYESITGWAMHWL
jgi:hypothetical protein